ncbi:MAG: hypothetical protein ACLQCU_04850 [Acidimicrobiales bacterium]
MNAGRWTLTAARVRQILGYRDKITMNPNPQPPTEEELTQMRLKLDRVFAGEGRLGSPSR